MSRKKVITTRQIVDADEEPEEREINSAIKDDPGEASYTQFVSRFSGAQGCRVKLYRQTPRGRPFCYSGTPEEITEESIREFHAKQPYANEEGTYILAVEVNGEPRSSFPIMIAPQVGTPGATPEPSGGMAEIVRLLQAQNDRLEARLAQQDRAPMSEMFDCMLKLDQLRGGGKSELPIDAIMKAVEIGKSLNPSAADDWNSLLISTLKDNGPMLMGLLTNLLKPGPTKTIPAALPEQPIQPQEEQPMPEQTEEERMQIVYKATIDFLKKKAEKASDPGLYVDMIVDNREEPIYARLIHRIVNEDFSAFIALDPDLGREPYNGFFRFIYDRIQHVFKPKDTVAAHSGRKAGDKANASANGATGKGSGK